ncbi:MAG TPA: hypothetical protein VN643_16125 [Pyrinomonadaceae bacterium]|nr:hypothetical protein [Pyrinomonadaceae bacterium]
MLPVRGVVDVDARLLGVEVVVVGLVREKFEPLETESRASSLQRSRLWSEGSVVL